MKIEVARTILEDNYTAGIMAIDGALFCSTIEDKVRDYNKDGDLLDAGETKIFGETAIPFGTYNIDLTMSPKFRRILPIIQDVPHFTGIRIHRGNTAKDSHGCILVGTAGGFGKVIKSTKYEMELVHRMLEAIKRGESLTIEII